MYRSQDAAKLTNELENEDNFEFSGATLKISIADGSMSTSEAASSNPKSAILSGSDVVSPPVVHPTINNIDAAAAYDANAVRQPPPSITTKPQIGSAAHFFSFRSGQFEKAITDCINILLRPANDTDVVGSWLLTEISHWDHERERVFILTTKTLLEVKYDFIALRILQHNKIRLEQIDTVLKGNISYPQSSLAPQIQGLTNGVASIINGAFTRSDIPNSSASSGTAGKLTIANRFDFTSFKPVKRTDDGVRIMWNKGQPLSLLTSWNPFASDIPWITIKNHPLYYYQDQYNITNIQEDLEKNRQMYSVENLHQALMQVIVGSGNVDCKFEDGCIYMQNYVGIGAVIHNKHNFGFFKVRGKFSF